MVKLFQTGDNHFGRKYDNYPAIRETLIRSRFNSLQDMVRRAEAEGCDFFVITGDLFDNNNRITKKDVRDVVEILAQFSGRVLVLPGNHDFHTGEEKLWHDFRSIQADHNITLLTEMRPYAFDTAEETVIFYPAPCQSKHAAGNNLGWIKALAFDEPAAFHIGVAHGAIEKLTPDMKNQYFLMTEAELNAVPLDAWLIGHTHIPYPPLPTDREETGYRIFNAGTHEQTDVSNHTPGYGFLLTLEHENGKTIVRSRAVATGRVFYPCLTISLGEDASLEQTITEAVAALDPRSVVRLILSGSVCAEEYTRRQQIYADTLARFLDYEIQDSELCQQITLETIRDTFPEISLAARLLMELMEDPREVRMAYDLLQSCRDGKEADAT